MRNYWNCTKFADKIRGTAKPEYATSEVWREWEQSAKAAHPFRFWLVEEGFEKIQNFINYPIDKLYDLKDYVCNRYITKAHSLQSNLKKGEFYDFDYRMIHCLFDELVNFVEIEKAWMKVVWSDDDKTKYKVPGWAIGPFRTRTWRCPQAGIDYLLWEINDPNCAGHQADTAKATLELYNWWTVERPNRPDPMDVSGWSEYCKDYNILNSDADDGGYSMKMINHIDELERQYDKEDEEMLIKLIKIRKGLWT